MDDQLQYVPVWLESIERASVQRALLEIEALGRERSRAQQSHGRALRRLDRCEILEVQRRPGCVVHDWSWSAIADREASAQRLVPPSQLLEAAFQPGARERPFNLQTTPERRRRRTRLKPFDEPESLLRK
jgi:hypothetical protein